MPIFLLMLFLATSFGLAADAIAACAGASPTLMAASTSQASFEECFTAAIDGDTILIPSGSVTWSATSTIANKSVIIRGQFDCTLNSDGRPTSCPTTITWNTTASLILWEQKPSGFPRLAHLAFQLPNTNCDAASDRAAIGMRGDTQNLRVDHLLFTAGTGSCANLHFTGNVRGVVDHNAFRSYNAQATVVWHGEWQNVNDAPAFGAFVGGGGQSWASAATFATADRMIFENNEYNTPSTYPYMVDDSNGARVTYRYNVFAGGTLMANHGTETNGRGRSVKEWEVYRNTFTYGGPASGNSPFTHLRGGSGYFFDNVATGTYSDHFAEWNAFRCTGCDDGLRRYTYWGGCAITTLSAGALTRSGARATVTIAGGPAAGQTFGFRSYVVVSGSDQAEYNGTFPLDVNDDTDTTFTFPVTGTPASPATGTITIRTAFDGNTDTSGYRCLDQSGAGHGDHLISGGGAGGGVGGDLTPLSNANQIVQPIYAVNNLVNGTLFHGESTASVVVENRDFFNQNVSYNGTTQNGVGRGARASRPASSDTLNDGWWSTDFGGDWDTALAGANDGCLDVWNGSSWTNCAYTPLVYPHSLVSGENPPPPPPQPPPAGVSGFAAGDRPAAGMRPAAGTRTPRP